MSAIIWFRKKSRLSTLVGQPGGSTIGKALSGAAELLAPLRQESLASVERAIAVLESRVTATAEGDDWLDEIYRQSSAVIKAAGPFEMKDVCRAAYSLCELTDRLKGLKRILIEPIRVHTDALRLLFANPDLPPEAKEQVLGGLDRVLARVPALAAAD